MARRPVPAEGSSTRSAGVSAAAVAAAKPSAIGVENCCSAWLSSERRVWEGSSAATSPASRAARREIRAPAHAAPEFAQEQNRRRLAGVVGRLPVPGAFGVGAAEGGGHRRAQRRGVDRLAAREWIEERMRRSHERCGNIGRIRRRSGHGRAGGRRQNISMGETSGERERENRLGALSGPDRLKPVPAVLYLSLDAVPRRRREAAVVASRAIRTCVREINDDP